MKNREEYGDHEEQEPGSIEEIQALNPVSFFAIVVDCYHHAPALEKGLGSKYLLPDLSELCDDAEAIAQVSLGWSQEGITACIEVFHTVRQVHYPDIQSGDSVELFFDTRNVKTSGWNTRFCHHFFFLPRAVDEIQAGEKTHFRTEDRHELCKGSDLLVRVVEKKNGYTMHVFIPAHCLHGYDPEQFNRLGFTYRINRHGRPSQHFSVVSSDYALEQQPSLWGTLRLHTA